MFKHSFRRLPLNRSSNPFCHGLPGSMCRAVGCVLFVLLTFTAMASYPGGSQFDPDAAGYRFFENCYSYLDNTVTSQGASNLVSVVLFAAAMSVAGVSVVGFFLVFRSLLSGI